LIVEEIIGPGTKSFKELFESGLVDLQDVLPGCRSTDDGVDEILSLTDDMRDEEEEHGVVGFRLRPVEPEPPVDSTTGHSEVPITPSNDEGGQGPVLSGRKRKRRGRGNRNKQRSRRRKKKDTEINRGMRVGFTVCSRRPDMVKGNHRTCVQDALFHACLDLGLDSTGGLHSKIIQQTLPVGGGDTEMETIIDFVPTMNLHCVSLKSSRQGELSLWQLPGGSMLNTLKLKQGVYLLVLKVVVDTHSDNHVVSFNAFKREIKDNHSDIIVLDSKDVESTSNSMKVFKHIFPGSTDIVLSDVHQLCHCS
jgi:hypothetical protein